MKKEPLRVGAIVVTKPSNKRTKAVNFKELRIILKFFLKEKSNPSILNTMNYCDFCQSQRGVPGTEYPLIESNLILSGKVISNLPLI